METASNVLPFRFRLGVDRMAAGSNAIAGPRMPPAQPDGEHEFWMRLEGRLTSIEVRQAHIERTLHQTQEMLKPLVQAGHRWRGGLTLAMVIAATLGALLSWASQIKRMLWP